MMLDARSPAFRRLLPNGCYIYDARGRLLRMVVACNPETGEVIRYQCNSETVATNANGGPRMRHGFWPAPLRVVPVPYRVGDGARGQRVEMLNRIAGRVAAATGRTPARKLTVADLDELIDKVEGEE